MNPPPRLSDADARVLDVLLSEGLDPEAAKSLQGEEQARAQQILRLLGRLEALPAPAPSESTVPSLMARIDALEAERRERMRVLTMPAQRRSFRLPDALTIAAILLVAVGVGWPLANSIRSATLREQCERNMGSIHAGLTRFAQDHDGRLPLTAGLGAFLTAGSGAGTDMRAAESAAPATVDWRRYRHGENLEVLRDRSYVTTRCLTCPGCEKDRGALALRVPAAGQRFTLATMRGMLVADANPAMDALRSGSDWHAERTNCSENHRSKGQNVLFDDGSVRWLLSPRLPNGDSIWVPCERIDPKALERGLLPTDSDDLFLTQ